MHLNASNGKFTSRCTSYKSHNYSKCYTCILSSAVVKPHVWFQELKIRSWKFIYISNYNTFVAFCLVILHKRIHFTINMRISIDRKYALPNTLLYHKMKAKTWNKWKPTQLHTASVQYYSKPTILQWKVTWSIWNDPFVIQEDLCIIWAVLLNTIFFFHYQPQKSTIFH